MSTLTLFGISDPRALVQSFIGRGVKPAEHRYPDSYRSIPGEIKLVAWVELESKRLGISKRALWVRLYRGTHAWPEKGRRVNSRRIYVVP